MVLFQAGFAIPLSYYREAAVNEARSTLQLARLSITIRYKETFFASRIKNYECSEDF